MLLCTIFCLCRALNPHNTHWRHRQPRLFAVSYFLASPLVSSIIQPSWVSPLLQRRETVLYVKAINTSPGTNHTFLTGKNWAVQVQSSPVYVCARSPTHHHTRICNIHKVEVLVPSFDHFSSLIPSGCPHVHDLFLCSVISLPRSDPSDRPLPPKSLSDGTCLSSPQ